MTWPFTKFELSTDFRATMNLAVAAAAVVFLLPFAINNLWQGRLLLGAGSLAIVLILALHFWLISIGRFVPVLAFGTLFPAVAIFLAVAFEQQGIIGALWCYPSVIAFYFMLSERKAWFANAVIVTIAVVESWRLLEHALAARVAATIMVVSVFAAIFVRIISLQQARLQERAAIDPLTGLHNRVLLDSTLEQAAEQGRRAHVPMSLVSMDLDHFKRINDTLGHPAGDTVLRGVGKLLLKRARRADWTFRIGGEEFLLLLHATDSDDGCRFAEELRHAIEMAHWLPERVVTASFGIATLRDDEDWHAWLKRSDDCLYAAKAAGRNRVVA